jgi:hypothetical protein
MSNRKLFNPYFSHISRTVQGAYCIIPLLRFYIQITLFYLKLQRQSQDFLLLIYRQCFNEMHQICYIASFIAYMTTTLPGTDTYVLYIFLLYMCVTFSSARCTIFRNFSTLCYLSSIIWDGCAIPALYCICIGLKKNSGFGQHRQI